MKTVLDFLPLPRLDAHGPLTRAVYTGGLDLITAAHDDGCVLDRLDLTNEGDDVRGEAVWWCVGWCPAMHATRETKR